MGEKKKSKKNLNEQNVGNGPNGVNAHIVVARVLIQYFEQILLRRKKENI